MKRYLAGLLICCCQVQAQWSNDPIVNTPVFTGPNAQFAVKAVSDGVQPGGAFAFWFHQETGATGIYAQRMDAGGNRVRPLPTQIFQFPLTGTISKDAIPDGSQGAIVTWGAKVTGSITDADIYVQRVDPNVDGSWGPYVIVCNAVNFQSNPRLVSNGSGGAIIAWEDRRAGGVSRVYAQHLNLNGQPQWPLDGIPLVNTTSQAQFKPMIATDGSGGTIVVWEDISNFYVRLYAQRIDSNGNRLWADTGAVVYFYPTGPTLRGIVEDGAGGAFVCWQDRSSHGDYNVFVQRIDAQGNRVWDPFGVRVSFSNKDVNPLMISDGSGGAIVAWEDSSLGTRQVNIYAQRISAAGALLWVPQVTVSDATNEQYYFSMIPGGNNGAIIAWTDARNWPWQQGRTGLDVYAQSLDGAGVPQWLLNGAPVSQPPAPSSQVSAQVFPILASDSAGGAIAFWEDSRNSGNLTDIYAQGLAAIGLSSSMTLPITQPNTNYPFVIGTTPLVTANFATLGSVSSMTIQAFINATPPGLTKALSRYLDLTAIGSGFNATLTFNYTDAEVAAAQLVNRDANLKLYRNSGAGWVLQGGTVDTVANTVTLTGVTGFSLWAMRDPSDTVVTTVRGNADAPQEFSLEQNYPNPFNPSSTISFDIGEAALVSLKIYDLLGQEVATLVNEKLNPGRYERVFDGKGLASGVYFYRLTAGSFADLKKLVLLK